MSSLRRPFPFPPADRRAGIPCGLLMLMLTAAAVPAGQVDWNGAPFTVNVTSTGQPWDASWVAELGAFAAGFTPTAANTASWAGAWRAASRSVYHPQTGYFAGSYIYDVNPPEFPAGGRGYIWLFHSGAPQGEWLLLTNPAWTWPAASPLAFPAEWETSASGLVAVLGTTEAPGWTLKSASVAASLLPPLPWTGWQNLYFTASERADPLISGPAADADGDGASNLAEYAAGTLARSSASSPPAPEIFLHAEGGHNYAAARLLRSTRVSGFAWQAQVSSNLSGWTGAVTPVSDLPWMWTVRADEDVTAQPRLFLRFGLLAAP